MSCNLIRQKKFEEKREQRKKGFQSYTNTKF